MNTYGQTARDWWEQHRPTAYAALQDPDGFFEELGERASGRVAATARRLQAGLPADLPYLEQVGQLTAIRRQAAEIVMDELVYALPVEESTAERLDELLMALPARSTLAGTISDLEFNRDLTGRETDSDLARDYPWTDAMATELANMQALYEQLPTQAQVDQMSPEQVEDTVRRLQAWLDPQTGQVRDLTVPAR